MVTSCNAIVQYNNQDIDIDSVMIENISIITRFSHAVLLYLHTLTVPLTPSPSLIPDNY